MHHRVSHPGAVITKRTLDVIGAGLVLLPLLPLFAVIWTLIKLKCPGPVFFGHIRLGRDGRRFKAWKFRTMIPNGDEVLKQHLETYPAARDEWERDQKLRDDPRVTPLGKWLRRCSLDE